MVWFDAQSLYIMFIHARALILTNSNPVSKLQKKLGRLKMGNVNERDGSGSEDFEDGEVVYDTLARDFAYKKCSKTEEDAKPIRRAASTRKSRRPAASRSISRTGRSFKRSNSRRKSGKKSNGFLISEMEVQVDGKVAKLVPRTSVLQKRGLASMLRSRLTIPKHKKSTRKSKVKKSMKARSTEYLSVAPTNFARRPSYDSAMAVSNDKSKNIFFSSVKPVEKERKKHTLADVFADKPASPKSRPKSTYANMNNNNISKTGNMALNIEKEKLRKIKSHNLTSDLSGELDRLTITPATEL